MNPEHSADMSRTQETISPIPTASAAGFVANLFRGTACIQDAFRQEGGELQYLEKCWSDSAVLKFILMGWIGLALKILLFVLVVTFLAACIQRRRPWYVFMSFIKWVGGILGRIFACFELDETERAERAEAKRGSGITWQEQSVGGGYFGYPKQKV